MYISSYIYIIALFGLLEIIFIYYKEFKIDINFVALSYRKLKRSKITSKKPKVERNVCLHIYISMSDLLLSIQFIVSHNLEM